MIISGGKDWFLVLLPLWLLLGLFPGGDGGEDGDGHGGGQGGGHGGGQGGGEECSRQALSLADMLERPPFWPARVSCAHLYNQPPIKPNPKPCSHRFNNFQQNNKRIRKLTTNRGTALALLCNIIFYFSVLFTRNTLRHEQQSPLLDPHQCQSKTCIFSTESRAAAKQKENPIW